MVDEDQDNGPTTDERRHIDRSRLIVDVSFDGGDATGVASTKDISLVGLYMSTQTEIPTVKTLTLRLDLGGQQVILKGDVVYSNPGHGVGVRFHRLAEDVHALMERELPRP